MFKKIYVTYSYSLKRANLEIIAMTPDIPKRNLIIRIEFRITQQGIPFKCFYPSLVAQTMYSKPHQLTLLIVFISWTVFHREKLFYYSTKLNMTITIKHLKIFCEIPTLITNFNFSINFIFVMKMQEYWIRSVIKICTKLIQRYSWVHNTSLNHPVSDTLMPPWIKIRKIFIKYQTSNYTCRNMCGTIGGIRFCGCGCGWVPVRRFLCPF